MPRLRLGHQLHSGWTARRWSPMIVSMGDAAFGAIGRDAELTAADAFLSTAQNEFALLTIEGEPGIGKTTVWREVLRRAEARGTRVVLTRPTEAEAALSFAGLADLFDAVGEDLISHLPVPQQEAISAALLRAPVPRGGIDERALCASVLSLLRLMAAEQSLLVAVDDAHWLDSSSAHVLSFAVRRLQTVEGTEAAVRTAAERAAIPFERILEVSASRSRDESPAQKEE